MGSSAEIATAASRMMFARAWLQRRHARDPARLRDEVGERITVEDGQERPERLVQCFPQSAGTCQRTRVRIGVETLHQRHRPLGAPDHVADSDLRCIARQREPTVASPDCLDVPEVLQLVDDFHGMMARDAERRRDIGRDAPLLRPSRGVDQDAERVVGE